MLRFWGAVRQRWLQSLEECESHGVFGTESEREVERQVSEN